MANATKKQTIPSCPACSNTKGLELKPMVYECGACKGIFSNHIYLGDSYAYVLPFMTNEDVPAERLRYFDFSGVSSQGPYRRHGWFDVETKRIVQVG